MSNELNGWGTDHNVVLLLGGQLGVSFHPRGSVTDRRTGEEVAVLHCPLCNLSVRRRPDPSGVVANYSLAQHLHKPTGKCKASLNLWKGRWRVDPYNTPRLFDLTHTAWLESVGEAEQAAQNEVLLDLNYDSSDGALCEQAHCKSCVHVLVVEEVKGEKTGM